MTKPNPPSGNAPRDHNVLVRRDEMPAELAKLTEQDAGKGVSNRREDQIVPIIGVVQTNSPCLDKGSDKYRGTAKVGDIILAGALDDVRDGEQGIETIFCEMVPTWTIWLPGRQGLVERRTERPSDAVTTLSSEGGRSKRVTMCDNGQHIAQETKEYYVVVEDRPYMLPLWSTRITFGRELQTHFHQFTAANGRPLPSFARKYRLFTAPKVNVLGRWYRLKFQDLGWVTKPEYELARALHNAVSSGTVTSDVSSEQPDADAVW
jgi:hypothetical protein